MKYLIFIILIKMIKCIYINNQYDITRNKIGKNIFKKFLKKSDIVLDCNCGSGECIKNISPYIDKIYGIEDNEIMYKESKRLNLNNLQDIRLESCIRTSFDNEMFDCLISNQNIQYLGLENIDSFFKESYRILKKRGKLIISTRNKIPDYGDLYWYTEFAPNALKKVSEMIPDEHYLYELLIKNKFNVIDIIKPKDETFMNEKDYLDINGIYHESWRVDKLFWNNVNEDELKNIQDNIHNMLENDTLNDFICKKEKIRKIYGQSIFIIAEKRY